MAFEDLTDRQRRLLSDLCREIDEQIYRGFHANEAGEGWFIVILGDRTAPQKTLDLWSDRFTLADLLDLDAAHYISVRPTSSGGYNGAIRKKGRDACGHKEPGPPRSLDTEAVTPQAQQLKLEAPLPDILPDGFELGLYTIVGEPLGKGGAGHVYKAIHRLLDKAFAIKLLSVDHLASADARRRFKREALLLQQVHSHNVVRAFEYLERAGRPYYIMEHLEGRNLSLLVQQKQRLQPVEYLPLLLQIIEGLKALHDLGAVHRDLKPKNLIVEDGGRLVVIDLGVARLSAEGEAPTEQGTFLGSPDYASPEQRRTREVDTRSDLYALGLVTYFALVGRRAFDFDDLRSMLTHIDAKPDFGDPDVPSVFRPVLAKACADEPGDRFTSVLEFGDAFRRAIDRDRVFAEATTITIADGRQVNLRAAPPMLKASALIQEAEWATHNLLNASGSSILRLRRRFEAWESGCLLLMNAAGCQESDMSDFRVLVTYEPRGLGGESPDHARLRDVIAEKIDRLKSIARRLESGTGPLAQSDMPASEVSDRLGLDYDPSGRCIHCREVKILGNGIQIEHRAAVLNSGATRARDVRLALLGVEPAMSLAKVPIGAHFVVQGEGTTTFDAPVASSHRMATHVEIAQFTQKGRSRIIQLRAGDHKATPFGVPRLTIHLSLESATRSDAYTFSLDSNDQDTQAEMASLDKEVPEAGGVGVEPSVDPMEWRAQEMRFRQMNKGIEGHFEHDVGSQMLRWSLYPSSGSSVRDRELFEAEAAMASQLLKRTLRLPEREYLELYGSDRVDQWLNAIRRLVDAGPGFQSSGSDANGNETRGRFIDELPVMSAIACVKLAGGAKPDFNRPLDTE